MRKADDDLVIRAVAAEIKARRAKAQISQEELAHRAGLHRSFIARLEVARTQPSIAALFRIAAGLDTSAVEVIEGAEKRHLEELRSQQTRAAPPLAKPHP